MKASRVGLVVVSFVAVWAAFDPRSVMGAGEANTKVPVTTASEDAKQAYLKGRDLLDKLRATDARVYFAKTAELDPSFALAHCGLANGAPTAANFFAALRQGVALAGKASEMEDDHAVQLLLSYQDLFDKVNGQGAEAIRRIERWRGCTDISIPMTYGIALL